MRTQQELTVDEETITKLGLRLSDKRIVHQGTPKARVFEYPQLDNVYVMETDFYGNPMPKDSCFLAFNGPHGFMGQYIDLETLKNAKPEEIQKIVENNSRG